MIFVEDAADDIENGASGYHTGNDTMSIDYSIERHVVTTKLMENAVWKAINDKVTKVAKFGVVVKGENADVTLTNAGDIFNTWYQVDARFTGLETGVHNVTFTPDNTTVALPADEYTISNVVSTGTGIADNMNATRNATILARGFKTNMFAASTVYDFVDATASACVAKMSGNKNSLTITVTEHYTNGLDIDLTGTFMIDNNSAGIYYVGEYAVYVNTKGNDQIRECYLVW
jgi:hypothetical protein